MSSRAVLPHVQPRYMLMAQRLADDIGTGHYAIDAFLPTEAVLARQFGVSRHTVREALRQLQSLGLVASHQGKRTRVVGSAPRRHYVQFIDSLEDLLQYAGHTRLVDIAARSVAADEALAAEIGCAPGRKFLRLEATRVAREGRRSRPVAWTQIYIADAYAGVRADVGRYRGAIGHLIEERYGERITEVRHEIRAVPIDADIAERLETDPGSPGLEVRRWYLGRAVTPFEYTVSLHPADQYTFSTRLRPQMANQAGLSASLDALAVS